MGSDVIRVDSQLKKEIEKLQEAVARETGKWISQQEAIRRLINR